jgi:hypothetical protein
MILSIINGCLALVVDRYYARHFHVISKIFWYKYYYTYFIEKRTPQEVKDAKAGKWDEEGSYYNCV